MNSPRVRADVGKLHEPPPVVVPKLVAASARHRTITFQAIDGVPLGPKFPTELARSDVVDLIELAQLLDPYQPRRRWFRRPDVDRRLRHHVRSGSLSSGDAEAVRVLALDRSVHWRFAHADLTARNVLRRSDGRLVLIDWEWAGLYPTGYELAFLWFSLSDVAGARDLVEDGVAPRSEAGFLVSAILIQLLHLHLFRGTNSPFLPRHQATLRQLLERLHRRGSRR